MKSFIIELKNVNRFELIIRPERQRSVGETYFKRITTPIRLAKPMAQRTLVRLYFKKY